MDVFLYCTYAIYYNCVNPLKTLWFQNCKYLFPKEYIILELNINR